MEWYYAVGNKKIGPVNNEEFKRLRAEGTIRSETLVWWAGLDNWKPYREVIAIFCSAETQSVLTSPLLPALRSGPTADSEASRQKEISCNNAFQTIAKLPVIGGYINFVVSLVIPYLIGTVYLPRLDPAGNILTGILVIAWNAMIIYCWNVGYWLGILAGCLTLGAGLYSVVFG